VPVDEPDLHAIYKILIAIKARCAIIISPHPAAARCITRVAEVMSEAARAAGAPDGAIGWMTTVTLEGTQELMKQREVAVILATGGMGLVRAAYSAGKPAYGVGPGNAPCYIESSADLAKAASDIMTGKCFDNGVLCSSPNSVVVDEAVAEETRRQFQALGGYFLKPAEADALAKVLVSPQRLPNPALVGKSATFVAEKAGFPVPAGTRALIAELTGVGRDFPLVDREAVSCPLFLCREGLARGMRALQGDPAIRRHGHTMSIHSKNDAVILEFGLHKPAFRICVNTPTTHGSIGLTTGLDPAMTLGCGGFGGNITSDNISPKHLLNIKRLAYELRPAVTAASPSAPAPSTDRRLPQAPPAQPGGHRRGSIDAAGRPVPEVARVRRCPGGSPGARTAGTVPGASTTGTVPGTGTTTASEPPATFVCEDDVRQALRANRRISVSERTIITPAARDLGESHGFFQHLA
jgi:acetaldehyde dehydrogenase (acetylating)